MGLHSEEGLWLERERVLREYKFLLRQLNHIPCVACGKQRLVDAWINTVGRKRFFSRSIFCPPLCHSCSVHEPSYNRPAPARSSLLNSVEHDPDSTSWGDIVRAYEE